MKLSFVINKMPWVVRYVPPTHPALLTPSGTYSLGCCDLILHTIFIVDGLEYYKSQKVLCHEITHAAMFSYGVLLTTDQEELIADIISTYGAEIIEVTNKVFNKIKNLDKYI